MCLLTIMSISKHFQIIVLRTIHRITVLRFEYFCKKNQKKKPKKKTNGELCKLIKVKVAGQSTEKLRPSFSPAIANPLFVALALYTPIQSVS